MTIVIPILFALIGLVGLIRSLFIISRSIDSEDWMRTNCEILESSVQKIITGEGAEYRAVIKYKYIVNGLSYEGDTVRFGRSSVLESTAYDIWYEYRKGNIARVYVDPKTPQRSVLIPGISPSVYVLIIIYILFFACGIGAFLYEVYK